MTGAEVGPTKFSSLTSLDSLHDDEVLLRVDITDDVNFPDIPESDVLSSAKFSRVESKTKWVQTTFWGWQDR